jgi:hypothetical protein
MKRDQLNTPDTLVIRSCLTTVFRGRPNSEMVWRMPASDRMRKPTGKAQVTRRAGLCSGFRLVGAPAGPVIRL